MTTWREIARQRINQVVMDNPDASPERLKALISQAYPFGERKQYPYKIWLSEVKRVTVTPPSKRTALAQKAIKDFWVKEKTP